MKTPEGKLEMVHLQLTRRCNLHCRFCGQWGENGFFAQRDDADLSFDEWSRVIDSILRYRDRSGISPDIMLWGGEPLLSPVFPRVVELLREQGFTLGMVTNGTLLDRYARIVRDSFKTVYVSLDGPREMHDQIRGAGVFEKVASNLELVRDGRAKIVLMSVISLENIEIAAEIPSLLAPLRPDKIILQQMIHLSPEEVRSYSEWLRGSFNQKAGEIYSWLMVDDGEGYSRRLREIIPKIRRNIEDGNYPVPVEFLEHGAGGAEGHCLSPWRHLHVVFNGDVLYCTDFYDFKAGNVRKDDLMKIFGNGLSKSFRREITAGNCPACAHCSWRGNESYRLDGIATDALPADSISRPTLTPCFFL